MPASGFYAPFYGARSRCFAVNMRHHLDDAPPLDSPEDNPSHPASAQQGHHPATHRDAAGGPAAFRTPAETLIGLFWATTGQGDRTPPRLCSQIVRKIADGQANGVAANARLFAVVNAAMSGAGIRAWDDKYFYDVWRPVVAIREPNRPWGRPE